MSDDIMLLKLVSGEEIIALAYRSGGNIYVSSPRLVEKGALAGKWITGINVNYELTNHPIIGFAVHFGTGEEGIQPNLVQKYKEAVGVAPSTTRSSASTVEIA